MLSKYRKYDAIIHFFFLLCFAVLAGGFLFLLNQISGIKNRNIKPPGEKAVDVSPTPITGSEEVTKTSTNIKQVITVPTPEKRVAYLNLNGSFTTQNTDWTDVKSTDILINLADEYGADAYVDWDASIKSSSSGSKAFVRLYDVTHGLGVGGSDLETSSIVGVRVASGRLYLWRGHNTYRVQIRSLNGNEATFEGGRIKIVY